MHFQHETEHKFFFKGRLAFSTQQFVKNKTYLSLSESLPLIMETQ